MRLLLNRITGTIFFIVTTFCIIQKTNAQCATPISVFPYNEDFETTNGNWVPGGTGSDWIWGTPAKPVITGAASGIKCWIIGGLTASKYNDGEASWLQSPCFDFTSLQYPYISFSVFWEMERRFDGANFQYSTNLGATWTNVGGVADPVNCLNDNWFNYTPVTYLSTLASVRDGWSGNIQSTSGSCQGGGGSGRWVNAQHCMPNLAGIPNVIFRFTFGAGTQCNAYDGFAIDDIKITEAPPNNASFTYSCTNNTTVNFANTSALCPVLSWDFGDVASIPNNSSTLQNPIHIFSGPGKYTVTLTATGPSNAPSTTTQTINILGLTTSVISNNNCFGDKNGSASVNVIPVSAAPFFYSWNTTPIQTTAIATALAGGTYTVTVNALNSCTTTATAIITEPAVLTHSVNIIQPGCAVATGSATITESGGTVPYTYSWFPSGGTGATASGLAPGNYIVTVTDSKLCKENISINIAIATPPNISIINSKDASCFGLSDGKATALATGGNPPYTYSWNTIPAQNTATVVNLSAGNYSVTVTDNNGCSAITSVQISEPPNGFCGEVYFPNAFTPNGDTKNDDFGPLGNIAAISNYHLLVYNRYGELVFGSKDPFERWNGFYKSKLNSPGSFVWSATYTYKGRFNRSEQGTVVIIR
ncbi:MAG: gliding motility-associated C-terminal domain-containing protein [Ferruginibacter sp.]